MYVLDMQYRWKVRERFFNFRARENLQYLRKKYSYEIFKKASESTQKYLSSHVVEHFLRFFSHGNNNLLFQVFWKYVVSSQFWK